MTDNDTKETRQCDAEPDCPGTMTKTTVRRSAEGAAEGGAFPTPWTEVEWECDYDKSHTQRADTPDQGD